MLIRLLTLSWILILLHGCGFEGGIVDNGKKPTHPDSGKETGDHDPSPSESRNPAPSEEGKGPSVDQEEIILGRFKVKLPESPDAPGKSLEEPAKSPDAEGYLYRNGSSTIEFKLVDQACEGSGGGTTKGGFTKVVCSDTVIHLTQGAYIVQLTHHVIASGFLNAVVESLEIEEQPVISE
jgi:hypothetical protein